MRLALRLLALTVAFVAGAIGAVTAGLFWILDQGGTAQEGK